MMAEEEAKEYREAQGVENNPENQENSEPAEPTENPEEPADNPENTEEVVEEEVEEEIEFEREIKIGDSWKKVFRILNAYEIEDVAVDVYNEGRLEIAEMSPSHTVLVKAKFVKEENKEIEEADKEEEALRVGIGVPKFYKALKSFGSFSDLTLTLKHDRLILEGEDQKARLPTIESIEEELPEPELEMTVKSEKVKITTALNKLKKVFGKQNPKLRITDGKIFLEYGNPDTLENFRRELGKVDEIYDEEEFEEFYNIYAYEYLEPLKKSWHFETANDLPIIFRKEFSSYNTNWEIETEVLIAPKIEPEAE